MKKIVKKKKKVRISKRQKNKNIEVKQLQLSESCLQKMVKKSATLFEKNYNN